MNKILKYTNEYGAAKCRSWENIIVPCVTDFISILFIASIQLRKGKTSYWWRSGPYSEFHLVRSFM
jgi:hypothetical protein